MARVRFCKRRCGRSCRHATGTVRRTVAAKCQQVRGGRRPKPTDNATISSGISGRCSRLFNGLGIALRSHAPRAGEAAGGKGIFPMVVIGNYRSTRRVAQKAAADFPFQRKGESLTAKDTPLVPCWIADISCRGGARLFLAHDEELPQIFTLLLTPKPGDTRQVLPGHPAERNDPGRQVHRGSVRPVDGLAARRRGTPRWVAGRHLPYLRPRGLPPRRGEFAPACADGHV